MLYLITGPNGGGKSLKSIELMHELHAKGINIFAFGYHDLKVPFADESLHPRDWKDMPPGSAMFVDEAQKVWRTRRGNREPPPELMEMEEHRYEGVDLYLISQDPSYIDSHIKGLVHKHWHCIPYGNKSSRVFCFSECQDNPQNMTKRAHAEFTVWAHPAKYYGCYTSAKFHMDKPKVPWRHHLPKLYKIAAALVLVWAVWAWFQPVESEELPEGAIAAEPSRGLGFFGGMGGNAPPQTKEEWIALHTPLDARFPVSAPIYHGQGVQDYPRPVCMASGFDGADSCTCLTQQGTRFEMDGIECRRMARFGPAFDPYRSSDTGASESFARDVVDPTPTAAGPAVIGTAGQAASYGGFRP